MQTLYITLGSHIKPITPLFIYHVAGFRLAIDRPISQLTPFLSSSQAPQQLADVACQQHLLAEHSQLLHESEAWVGNAMRRVRCWFDGHHHEIEISGIGLYSITADGLRIALLQTEQHVDDSLLIEALLGPALILALSICGVFSLHASAVTLGDGAILFLGDSGAGKSTIARLLHYPDANVRRMTDDISPFIGGEGGFELLPEFPQLKLAASQQCSGMRHSSIAISAIYQLNRVPHGKAAAPSVSRQHLGGIEAFRMLTGQSVASRLFTPQLLRKHARNIGALCEAVPAYRLTYPDGMDQFAAVRNFLLAHH